MTGSVFGHIFRVMTFGESHGPAVGAVVDGCPPGVELDESVIQKDLDRRRPGQSEATTARDEPDAVEILSGVINGYTTGTPLALLIRNRDADPSAYDELKDRFRPGHGDLTYFLKYGIRDHRGGGRASGRETAARVAAGAVARRLLSGFGVSVRGATVQVGSVMARDRDYAESERNPLRCPDAEAAETMTVLLREVREEGDSVGGVVEVTASGVPAGLGEPVFGKLDALLAGAMMSIGAVKGVEIGDGFECASRRGSENSDPLYKDAEGKVRSRHNRGGGVLAGISTGEDLRVRLAVKPMASISKEQETVDVEGNKTTVQVRGRHDPCLCPRIVPVAEAMMCLVLADALFHQRAVTGTAGPVREFKS
ncbi:MAG: chorismate synthase [bacterium]